MNQSLVFLLLLALPRPHPMPAAAQSAHQISFVSVAPNVRVEVLDWGGTGPAMVFLAGFGHTGHVFDDFAAQFATTFRVIGITRRGFGASTRSQEGYTSAQLAHDITTVLDSLGVHRATFVAHSFGGSELNYLGAFHADRVSRLIYLDASYDFPRLYADSVWQHAFPIPRPASPPSRAIVDLRRWYGLVVGPGLPDDEIHALASGASESIAGTFQRGAAAINLRSIAPPVLVVWAMPASASDQYPYWASLAEVDRQRLSTSFEMQRSVRRDHLEAFRTQVPRVRIVEVAGGRHHIFLSHPRQVTNAVRAWLGSQTPQPNDR